MLGLCCGVSFLSIFEIIFWILKAFFSELFGSKINEKVVSKKSKRKQKVGGIK